jgi:hypothetical protein
MNSVYCNKRSKDLGYTFELLSEHPTRDATESANLASFCLRDRAIIAPQARDTIIKVLGDVKKAYQPWRNLCSASSRFASSDALPPYSVKVKGLAPSIPDIFGERQCLK